MFATLLKLMPNLKSYDTLMYLTGSSEKHPKVSPSTRSIPFLHGAYPTKSLSTKGAGKT